MVATTRRNRPQDINRILDVLEEETLSGILEVVYGRMRATCDREVS